MKIALACDSLLLSKSLEIFLKKYIVTYKKCDFVISDRKLGLDKPEFVISDELSNLQRPFSQSSLMIELDKFYRQLRGDFKDDSSEKDKKEDLKKKIDFLTQKFSDDLYKLVAEHYEK
jgi:hypothetical protein